MNEISDHQPCFIVLDFWNVSPQSSKYIKIRKYDENYIFNFKQAVAIQWNLGGFITDIQGNPNENYNTLNGILSDAINRYLPSNLVNRSIKKPSGLRLQS